jgi:capsular polysaccharide biosynthesis protein
MRSSSTSDWDQHGPTLSANGSAGAPPGPPRAPGGGHAPPPPPELTTPAEDLASVLRALRRHWPAAVAILAATLLTAVAITQSRPTHYEAAAEILLQQPDQVNSVLNPDGITSAANAQREVNTNTDLITSVPVANAVRRRLGLTESASALIDQLSVSGESTSNLVEIVARDARPDRAAAIATAVAVEYQNYRRRSAQDAIGLAIRAARQRLAAMNVAGRESAEGQALLTRLHQLQTGSAVATGGVQVVRAAEVPEAPAPRMRPLTTAVVVLLGLVLAAIAVFLLARTDRRLHDEDDAESAFGLPVITRIPGRRRRAMGEDPARLDAFDALAARLRPGRSQHAARTLMVAPAVGRRGDDFTVHLAAALAELGERVLVIEADIRSDGRAARGPLLVSGGLTAILRGDSTLDAELVLASRAETADDGEPMGASSGAWQLVAAGPGTRRPTPLLAGAAMEELVREARERADVVIIAAPALTAAGDCLALAPLCDAIVVVVGERAVARDAAERVRDVLSATPTPVLGIVFEQRSGDSWSPPPEREGRRSRPVSSGPSGEQARPSSARA